MRRILVDVTTLYGLLFSSGQSDRGLGLFDGGAMATGDGGAADAVFPQSVAGRNGHIRTINRATRRDEIGDIGDVAFHQIDNEHAWNVRIGNAIETDFAGTVLQRHPILDLHDGRRLRLFLQIVGNQGAPRLDIVFEIGLVRSGNDDRG